MNRTLRDHSFSLLLYLLYSPTTLFCKAREGFNDLEGRGYDDFVPGEVIKTAPSGDETT